MTSSRAQTLADRFQRDNDQLVQGVERLTDADWRKMTSSEGWTVGATAHHIATGHHALTGLMQLIAGGQPVPPLTMDMIHQGNAEHAKQFAHCSKTETLELLRKNGAAASAAVRGLSDAQLDRTAALLGGTMSAAQIIERIMIHHIEDHYGSIRKAVGGH